jgi:hypothetical protein
MWVLDAVDEYLNWLDVWDKGRPWESEKGLVDYLKHLRRKHPLLVSWVVFGIEELS